MSVITTMTLEEAHNLREKSRLLRNIGASLVQVFAETVITNQDQQRKRVKERIESKHLDMSRYLDKPERYREYIPSFDSLPPISEISGEFNGYSKAVADSIFVVSYVMQTEFRRLRLKQNPLYDHTRETLEGMSMAFLKDLVKRYNGSAPQNNRNRKDSWVEVILELREDFDDYWGVDLIPGKFYLVEREDDDR